ncbi:MAG: hypothetical protein JSS69_14810 [Acidobacteria bacterium]|nr:hypothetical protein [Acidobacteriota bacterium]MBS1867182.1 hypothetical protein [Acidobacteriota bacterium]
MPLRSRIYPFNRTENRIPMEVGVYLEGNRQVPGAEATITENVSAKGARVVSVRKWEPNDQLVLTSRNGEFRSAGRVAYCQPLQGDGFAIGVEFLDAKGRWIVQNAR